MPQRSLVYSGHAVLRMVDRGLDETAVHAVLDGDDVIETYPDDVPYPSALYLGFVSGRPVHVVAAEDADGQQTIVITVYEPDPALWDATFRMRTTQ